MSSYYAKTLGELPGENVAPESGPKLDLSEVFIYQLLQLTDIGASEIHLVLDSAGYAYMATKLSKDRT